MWLKLTSLCTSCQWKLVVAHYRVSPDPCHWTFSHTANQSWAKLLDNPATKRDYAGNFRVKLWFPLLKTSHWGTFAMARNSSSLVIFEMRDQQMWNHLRLTRQFSSTTILGRSHWPVCAGVQIIEECKLFKFPQGASQEIKTLKNKFTTTLLFDKHYN